MRAKIWVFSFLLLSLCIIGFTGILNYAVDPYGLNSNKHKFVENLTKVNKPVVTKLKINNMADYYIIGTSRAIRVDPNLIEKYLNDKKVYNINISGATFKENLMLANKVKGNSSHMIYGFDTFSLNTNRLSKKELVHRYESYKSALESKTYLSEYFSFDLLKLSLKDILKKILKKDFSQYFKNLNTKEYTYTIQDVDNYSDISNQGTEKVYSNYKCVDDSEIVSLAEQADENDIFVIYPKHFYHYILFHKYQNIEQQYFHALKLLVTHTDAKVWSFYQMNSITTDPKNFDDNGWHFKPKVSHLIFAKIFNDRSIDFPDDFGIQVTKENIDQYFEETRKALSAYE